MAKSIIKRQSLSDQAIQIIKTKILDMDFQFGERLVVDNLANQLQISRTPVRDALKTLVEQGLVTYDGIHYKIVEPTKKDIEDIFSVRAVLEALATKQAVTRTPQHQLEEFYRDFMGKTNALKISEDSNQLVETDIYLHSQILEFSDDQKLANLLGTIREQCWFIRRWCISEEDDIFEETVKEEHINILDNMIAGNASQAGKKMEIHLMNSWKRIVDLPNFKKIIK